MNSLDRIVVTGIEFYGYHGASDEEQAIGHRYVVDVVLEADLRKAGQTDALEDTINYAEVTQLILRVGTSRQFRLMEALAETLASELLRSYPHAQAIHLRVSKRLPPAGAIIESAGVEMTRRRDSIDGL